MLASIVALAAGVGLLASQGLGLRGPEAGARGGSAPTDDAPASGDLAGWGGLRPPQRAGPVSLEGAPDPAEAREPPEPLDPAPRPDGWPADAPTLRCRVRIVDALTGAPIEKRWRLRVPSSAAPPPSPGAEARPSPEPSAEPLRYDGRPRGPNDEAALRHDDPDSQVLCVPEVDLPDEDYVQWDRIDDWTAIAAGVEGVVLVVPLRPARTLEVEVVGPTGAPALGAEVSAVRVDGRVLRRDSVGSARYGVDDRGIAKLPGIPHVPGARLEAEVRWLPPGPEGTEATVVESTGPLLRLWIPATLPTPWHAVLRLKGLTRVAASSPEDADALGGESFDNDLPERPVPRGSAVVDVLGWEGRPLEGVRVEAPGATRTTGLDGRVRFDGLLAGDAVFTLDASGRFRASVAATVREGAVASVVLAEPRGGRLDLRVVDEDGRPWPTARIDVQAAAPPSWFDVEGALQRLDPFTDEQGRRSIARVAPGPATVRATAAGGRSAEARLLVRDGETHALTLVLHVAR